MIPNPITKYLLTKEMAAGTPLGKSPSVVWRIRRSKRSVIRSMILNILNFSQFQRFHPALIPNQMVHRPVESEVCTLHIIHHSPVRAFRTTPQNHFFASIRHQLHSLNRGAVTRLVTGRKILFHYRTKPRECYRPELD